MHYICFANGYVRYLATLMLRFMRLRMNRPFYMIPGVGRVLPPPISPMRGNYFDYKICIGWVGLRLAFASTRMTLGATFVVPTSNVLYMAPISFVVCITNFARFLQPHHSVYVSISFCDLSKSWFAYPLVLFASSWKSNCNRANPNSSGLFGAWD